MTLLNYSTASGPRAFNTDNDAHVRCMSNFVALLSCEVHDTPTEGIHVSTGDSSTPKESSTNGDLASFMVAKVHTDKEPHVCCTAPSFDVHNTSKSFNSNESLSEPSTMPLKNLLEQAAAVRMSQPIALELSELHTLPFLILWNFSRSFTSLIDSRLKSSLRALVQQMKKRQITKGSSTQDLTVQQSLVQLLTSAYASSTSSPVCPTAIRTSFRAIVDQLEDCVVHVGEEEDKRTSRYSIPLVFDAVLDLKIFGKHIPIHVQAPGTTTGTFLGREPGSAGFLPMSSVDIKIDTEVLLRCMMTQVRDTVRIAMAIGTHIVSSYVRCHDNSQSQASMNATEKRDLNESTTTEPGHVSPTRSSLSLLPPVIAEINHEDGQPFSKRRRGVSQDECARVRNDRQ